MEQNAVSHELFADGVESFWKPWDEAGRRITQKYFRTDRPV